MFPNPTTPTIDTPHSGTPFRRLLGGMSLFTMLMTILQVLTLWFSHQAARVSMLTWNAYLVFAVIWFWFGIQSIYLPCVGWVR